MTEEENKAIELIGCLNLNESYIITSKQWNEQDVHKAIDTILNLIEKLQKENKELKEKNDNNNVYKDLQEDLTSLLKKEFIPKDKIREKLERLENQKENYKEQPLIYMLLKNQLKSLIEEKQYKNK